MLQSEVSRESLFASGQMLDDLPKPIPHHRASQFSSAEIDQQCANDLRPEIETKGQPIHGTSRRLAISV